MVEKLIILKYALFYKNLTDTAQKNSGCNYVETVLNETHPYSRWN